MRGSMGVVGRFLHRFKDIFFLEERASSSFWPKLEAKSTSS